MRALQVREPAVAGSFYPGSAAELGQAVDTLLAAAPRGACPKALVVPHAGYRYSGPIAASGFARLRDAATRIERVVLVGPAHRVYVDGLAEPGVDALATPLGRIAVDRDALAQIDAAPHPRAHAREHCLEVELPFLQKLVPHAKLVPLLASDAPASEVGAALAALWGGPETLIVISSDLSHYHAPADARRLDARTAERILALDATLDGNDACGAVGINGLLHVARAKGLRAELIDLRNSGDTSPDRDEVVGYGAFAFYEE
ncbi:MAG TPA: AmmeMemoRadiSam system protein B [Kofleriaceae bacterium]|nr:AmmeMemoRadiSam system protein B [Kofleriaceae bacterium]